MSLHTYSALQLTVWIVCASGAAYLIGSIAWHFLGAWLSDRGKFMPDSESRSECITPDLRGMKDWK